jgi:Na+-transporting NADH:ubiquinone oxidoreductase subunit NqrC
MNPTKKTVFTALMLSLFSGALHATEVLDLKTEIEQCRDVTDSLRRLVCFDEVAKLLQLNNVTSSGVSTDSKESSDIVSMKAIKTNAVGTQAEKLIAIQPGIQPVIQSKIQSVEQRKVEEEFAKPVSIKSVESEVDNIVLTIDKLKKMLRGEWKITFTNGQVWQQKDSLRLSLKEGQDVKISKGALSSYYLKKEQNNKRIKVKRLK